MASLPPTWLKDEVFRGVNFMFSQSDLLSLKLLVAIPAVREVLFWGSEAVLWILMVFDGYRLRELGGFGVEKLPELLLLPVLECFVTRVGVDWEFSSMELSFVVDKLAADCAEVKL